MGDVGDVWNAVKDTATLFSNHQSISMGQRAFACPNGVQPSGLDWSNGAEQTLTVTKTWTNRAREWFGMSTGTQLRIGCTWTYGGSSTDHPGAYLHDAYLWAVLDWSTLGDDFTITGGFGDAVPYGNTCELSGWIDIVDRQFTIQQGQYRYDLRVRGNGAGTLRPV
jgi:hypothetical protein